MAEKQCERCKRRYFASANNQKRCHGCRTELGAANPPASSSRVPRNCDWCGRSFPPRMAHQRFHSGLCREQWKKQIHGDLYGPDHRARRAATQRIVDAGEAVCVRCGFAIVPGEPWDLGHVDGDPSQYWGPEHRACNRAAPNYRRAVQRQPSVVPVEDDEPLIAFVTTSRAW